VDIATSMQRDNDTAINQAARSSLPMAIGVPIICQPNNTTSGAAMLHRVAMIGNGVSLLVSI